MERYVISAELDLPKTKTVVNPRELDNFRADLTENLQNIGKDPLWIASETLRSGLKRAINRSTTPIVSLDDRYINPDEASDFLGVSRAVDENLDDFGYLPRVNYPTTKIQLDQIARKYRKVRLLDDVVFSGENMCWLIDELTKRNVEVDGVIAGVIIGEGATKLNEIQMPFDAVAQIANVDDEICERDFALVNGSGRRMTTGQNALYFDNIYGRPAKWASIPANETTEFCAASLQRNLQLLKPKTRMTQIGQFFGYNNDGLIIDAIKQRMEILQ